MYEYTLKFCNTTADGNTDTLSWLPLPVVPANVHDSPVTAGQFCSWTQKDPIPSKVVQFLQQDWPCHGEPSITPFSSRISEVVNSGFLVVLQERLVLLLLQWV